MNYLTWVGIGAFGLALGSDFWSEWLAPRVRYRSWFPQEPNLPAAAGNAEPPSEENRFYVILAGYLAGGGFIIIGLLDASSIQPACFPYAEVARTYGVAAVSLCTGFMWFSEGQNVTMQYHKGIRYSIGSLGVLIPLYMSACGTGVL